MSRERDSIAVGMERLGAVLQELGNPLEVVQQRELSRRIVPLT
jgi:hypothetical protein